MSGDDPFSLDSSSKSSSAASLLQGFHAFRAGKRMRRRSSTTCRLQARITSQDGVSDMVLEIVESDEPRVSSSSTGNCNRRIVIINLLVLLVIIVLAAVIIPRVLSANSGADELATVQASTAPAKSHTFEELTVVAKEYTQPAPEEATSTLHKVAAWVGCGTLATAVAWYARAFFWPSTKPASDDDDTLGLSTFQDATKSMIIDKIVEFGLDTAGKAVIALGYVGIQAVTKTLKKLDICAEPLAESPEPSDTDRLKTTVVSAAESKNSAATKKPVERSVRAKKLWGKVRTQSKKENSVFAKLVRDANEATFEKLVKAARKDKDRKNKLTLKRQRSNSVE